MNVQLFFLKLVNQHVTIDLIGDVALAGKLIAYDGDYLLIEDDGILHAINNQTVRMIFQTPIEKSTSDNISTDPDNA